MKPIILMKKIKTGIHGPSELVKQLRITVQIGRRISMAPTVRGTQDLVMEKLRMKSPIPPPRPVKRDY